MVIRELANLWIILNDHQYHSCLHQFINWT